MLQTFDIMLNNKNRNLTQDDIIGIVSLWDAKQFKKRYFEMLFCIVTKLNGDLSSERGSERDKAMIEG